MEVKASTKSIRMSSRKVRLVADLIRDKSVVQAESVLAFTNKGAAAPLRKLLKSAVANATHNANMKASNLYVKAITVNQGMPLKRMRPRAFGRGYLIKKHSCHINLVLAEKITK